MNILEEGAGYIVLLKGRGGTVKLRVHRTAPKYTEPDLVCFAWSPACRKAVLAFYMRFPTKRLPHYVFSMHTQLATETLKGFSDDGLVGEVKTPPRSYPRSNPYVRRIGQT